MSLSDNGQMRIPFR